MPDTDEGVAFLTEVNGHLLLTANATAVTNLNDYALREMAAEYEKASGNDQLMHLTGAFVEAEKANVNGAYWGADDLSFGELTPIHAPVNFLHKTRHIIGCFTDSKLYKPTLALAGEAAAAVQRPFLGVNAVVWREFFPYESRMIEMASAAKNLFWSMECQSRTIRCETSADRTRTGCGAEYPFEIAMRTPQKTCAHMRERSSQRHFVQPRFNAGAVIVPPVKPGWREAHAEVRAQAEKLAEHTFAEAASARGYDDATLVELMGRIVEFGKTLS